MPCTDCQGTPLWDSYEPIETQDTRTLDRRSWVWRCGQCRAIIDGVDVMMRRASDLADSRTVASFFQMF